MRLTELLSRAGMDFPEGGGYEDINITGITCDTRRLHEGNLFVALCGRHTDTHERIGEAVLRGAAALLVEKGRACTADYTPSAVQIECTDTRAAMARLADAYYGFPSRGMQIVGVTGTNGKTTVAHLLLGILRADGRRVGLIGTTGAFIMDRALKAEGISPDAHMTTPDPEVLYRLLAEMRDAGCDTVVMEATSHASALQKLLPIRFSLLIFTNLTRDHLDFHGTMAAYFDAKARLVRQSDTVIVNLDGSSVIGDPEGYGERMALLARDYGKTAVTVTASDDQPADVKIGETAVDRQTGIAFTLRDGEDLLTVKSPLIGRFNVMNLAEAVTAARRLGVRDDVICRAISEARGVKGRMERVSSPGRDDITVLIDFAHTPDALESLLFAVREMRRDRSRIRVLFGCGGDRDRTKRREMAQIASRMADMVYVTEDNRRNEDIGQIFSDILKGIDKERPYAVIERREEAIERAITDAETGDIVLLCGKGHEEYTVDQNGTHEFFEGEIARRALAARASHGGGHRDEN